MPGRLFKSPIFICAVALILRVALIVALDTYHKDPTDDHIRFGFETGRVARSIVLGHGISSPFRQPSGPTGIMMPLFPYMVAGVFKLFGIYTPASAFVVLSLSSLFSALTCLVVFSLADLSFGRAVAVISAWVWALHPAAIFISVVRVWETTLGTLMMMLLVLVVLRVRDGARVWAWFGVGVLCGLTALSNPAVTSVLPFWALWLWFRLRRRGLRPFRSLALTLVACLLTVTPWFVRNYRVFHRSVPFRTNFGLELQIGNNPLTLGGPVYDLHPIQNPQEFARYNQLGELAYMAAKKQQAFDFIAAHPGRFVRLTLSRVAFWWTYLWQIPAPGALGYFESAAGVFGFGLQAFLTFLGLWLAWRKGNDAAVPFVALLGAFPLVYYVTFPQLRFRHPIEPIMAILCVYALRRTFYGERGMQPALGAQGRQT